MTSIAIDSELLDIKAFDHNLTQQGMSIPLFRETLKQSRLILEERFHAGRAATELVHQQALVIDYVLQRIWQHFFKVIKQTTIIRRQALST